MTAYFDNSATTRPLPQTVDAMRNALEVCWGNPSAANGLGTEAYDLLEKSRKTVIASLGIKDLQSGSLFFTGSGTEADNLAINGTVFSKNFRFRPRIITTDSEHPAVLRTVEYAESRGAEVIYLPTVGGVIDLEYAKSLLTPETVLVSIMRVNNETGAVYDIKPLFEAAKKLCPEAVTHTDAVQGYMKLDCNPKKLCADMVSFSGHKIGGPKGIGALWCDKALITKKRILPVIFGGGQEGGYRSGTENMPGIAGLAAAAAAHDPEKDREKVVTVRERILSELPSGTALNLPVGETLPNIISLRCEGVKSEVLVRELASRGVSVSSGSACSTKKLKTSHVLTAFGLAPKEADSTIRISISPENTPEEADYLTECLSAAIKRLKR